MEINKQGDSAITQIKECFHCGSTQSHLFICECGQRFCCTEDCPQNHAMEHIKNCNDSRGLVNFSNDSNQTHIDSCLICLFHTSPLRSQFLATSQDFSFQKCAKKYLPVIQSLIETFNSFWKQNQPERLCELRGYVVDTQITPNKYQLSPFNEASKTFSRILDLINSAICRGKKKSIVEKGKFSFFSGHRKLQTKWLSCLQQVLQIASIFSCLIEESMKCQLCGEAIRFVQPFRTVCLPIPNHIGFLEVRVIYCEFGKRDESIFISFKKPIGKLIEKDAIDKLGESIQRFVLFLISEEGLVLQAKVISGEDLQLERIYNKTFLIQLSAEQNRIGQKSFITCSFWSNTDREQNRKRIAKFKMPFFFDLLNSTGLAIYKKILKFLYSKAYLNKKKRTVVGLKGHSYEQFEKMFDGQKWGKISLFKTKIRIVNEEKIIIYEEKELDFRIETNFYQALKSIFPSEKEFDGFIKGFEIRVFLDEHRFQFGKILTDDFIRSKADLIKKEGHIKFQDCLKAFYTEQEIGTKQQPIWQCGLCEQKVVAIKTRNIAHSSEIIVFTLDRFQKTKQKAMSLNRSSVQILLSFDFSNFARKGFLMPRKKSTTEHSIFKNQVPSTSQSSIQGSDNYFPSYSLYAFIIDEGQGEYIPYIKIRQTWFKFKDEVAFPIRRLQALQPNANIFFYQRC